jgi:bacterial/archaeal transporter family protein
MPSAQPCSSARQVFTKLAAHKISHGRGVFWSVLTGVCVGVGTILFFLLFQKGGPLCAVPMILAGGAAWMAVAGILFFKEPVTTVRLAGIALALAGLFLLRSPAGN